jgi:hypothetical protein
VTSRPRNVQQLITEWVCQTRSKHACEHTRGYDARYAQGDIDRQRAIDEATAAAMLATQYIAGDCSAQGVT